MSIIQEIKELKPSPKELRKFGLTMAAVFFLIAVYIFIKRDADISYIFAGFSIIFFIGAVVKPAVLLIAYKLWMSLAICLSWVMTRGILGVLFYVGFTAIKVIAKIAGKEFLDLKIDKNRKSYWIKREQKEFDKSTFERQF